MSPTETATGTDRAGQLWERQALGFTRIYLVIETKQYRGIVTHRMLWWSTAPDAMRKDGISAINEDALSDPMWPADLGRWKRLA